MVGKSLRRLVFLFVLVFAPVAAFGEDACPPGSYPVGGQGVQGCAPIPQSGTGEPRRMVPDGEWETRWGAVAEGKNAADPNGPTATGVSVSQKSKKAAVQLALQECKRGGGQDCEIRIDYYNQCVALADPTAAARDTGATLSSIVRAETLSQASTMAMQRCEAGGQQCEVVYSACSLSEFRSFR